MSRLVRFSLVALILASLPYAGLGQPAGAGPGAPAVSDSETANIIRLNPKLDLLNRVQPQIIPAVVGRLRRYGQSLQDDLYRGNDRPTPAEKTELAANPAFYRAFEHQPQATLQLLRYVNNMLHQAGR